MILVCGHNNAWQLTYRFDAISRGAVNRVREVHRSAAGKGVNVARVLAALGAPATLLAYLGGLNGARVREALADEGIAAEVIDTAADTRTCVTLLETGTSPHGAAGAVSGVAAGGSVRRIPEMGEPALAASAGDDRVRTIGAGLPASGRRGRADVERSGVPAVKARPATKPGELALAAGAGKLAGGAVGETRQVTELVEPAVVATAAEQERFSAAYDCLLEQAIVVVIAGSAIGGAHREVYARMVRQAQGRGVPTLLDAYHGHGRAALAAAPEIVKINRAELAELAGTAVDTEAARTAAYRGLCDRYGVRWVIVSAGAEGIEACDGRRLLRAVAPAVPVVNSIGSGDAASAGVAAALLGATGVSTTPAPLRVEEADLAVAVRHAVACGSANCLTAIPGLVTLEAIAGLHAKVAVTETPV